MQDDIETEARRIVAAGEAQGIVLRLLGGLAVRLHAPRAAHRALARSYPDIDFATPARSGRSVETLMAGLGYEPNRSFNLLNGASRLLFYDQPHTRQIDVFVGGFDMCHRLPIAERLDREPLTLPLAELLLTKLQIVQMNEKDLRDICALLLDHPLGDTDLETVNLPRLLEICGEDWGLWKTVTLSLEQARQFCKGSELEPAAQQTILERLDHLGSALDAAPKSLKWKMRAAVGERVQWYTLPEEVQRG